MALNPGDADYLENVLGVKRKAAPLGLEEVQLIGRLYVTLTGKYANRKLNILMAEFDDLMDISKVALNKLKDQE